MTYEFRPYQSDLLNRVSQSWDSGNQSVLIQLQEINRFTVWVRSDLDVWEDKFNCLCFTQQLNSYKPGWIGYRLTEMKPPLKIWIQAALYLEHQGWAYYRWRGCQEVKAA